MVEEHKIECVPLRIRARLCQRRPGAPVADGADHAHQRHRRRHAPIFLAGRCWRISASSTEHTLASGAARRSAARRSRGRCPTPAPMPGQRPNRRVEQVPFLVTDMSIDSHRRTLSMAGQHVVDATGPGVGEDMSTWPLLSRPSPGSGLVVVICCGSRPSAVTDHRAGSIIVCQFTHRFRGSCGQSVHLPTLACRRPHLASRADFHCKAWPYRGRSR